MMHSSIIIIGASGHGKVVADIAKKNGYETIVFLDKDESKKKCGPYPVIGNDYMLPQLSGDIIIAIGNASIRQALQESIDEKRIATMIHPSAVIADDVLIGAGSVVMAGAVINSGAVIGKGCIINTCASIDHDCVIHDYAHISIGVHLAGRVSVGKSSWVGAGATISNDLSVVGDCMIGAGAVVVKNIEQPGTYVGVPAVKINDITT